MLNWLDNNSVRNLHLFLVCVNDARYRCLASCENTVLHKTCKLFFLSHIQFACLSVVLRHLEIASRLSSGG